MNALSHARQDRNARLGAQPQRVILFFDVIGTVVRLAGRREDSGPCSPNPR
jgi:hypothetical protein